MARLKTVKPTISPSSILDFRVDKAPEKSLIICCTNWGAHLCVQVDVGIIGDQTENPWEVNSNQPGYLLGEMLALCCLPPLSSAHPAPKTQGQLDQII